MDLTNLTPNILTELLKIVEQKQALEKRLVSIDAQISAVASGLKPSKTPAIKKEMVATKKKLPVATKKRAKKGAGSQAVVAALESVGPEGISIPELKKKVAVSGAYLNALLGSLVKKGIATRVGRGAYAAKSSELAKASSPVTDSSPAEPTVAA